MAQSGKQSKSKKTGKKAKKVKITSENKCSFCTESKCCRYVTHQIDTPRSMQDFDYLLWQVAHQGVQLFKDDDGWFLLFNSSCEYIMPDGGCGIYERRPMICREHSNDYCEFDESAEDGFDHFFADGESLEKYCRKRFKRWDKRFKKLAKE